MGGIDGLLRLLTCYKRASAEHVLPTALHVSGVVYVFPFLFSSFFFLVDRSKNVAVTVDFDQGFVFCLFSLFLVCCRPFPVGALSLCIACKPVYGFCFYFCRKWAKPCGLQEGFHSKSACTRGCTDRGDPEVFVGAPMFRARAEGTPGIATSLLRAGGTRRYDNYPFCG